MEWDMVRRSLLLTSEIIKDESSPEAFLSDLQELAHFCEDWWDNRTKREGKPRVFSKFRQRKIALSFDSVGTLVIPFHYLSTSTRRTARLRNTRASSC